MEDTKAHLIIYFSLLSPQITSLICVLTSGNTPGPLSNSHLNFMQGLAKNDFHRKAFRVAQYWH